MKRILMLGWLVSAAVAATVIMPRRPQFSKVTVYDCDFTSVGGPKSTEQFVITNVVRVVRNHNTNEPCTLIEYVRDGKTNEFHAWLCKVKVEKQ